MQTPSQKVIGIAVLLGIVVYFWSIWTPESVGGGEAAPSGAGLEVPPQAAAALGPR